jgi:hypothetical protein
LAVNRSNPAINESHLVTNGSNLALNGLKNAEKCSIKEMEAIIAYCKYGTKLLVRVEVSEQLNEHECTRSTHSHEGSGLGSASSRSILSSTRTHEGPGLGSNSSSGSRTHEGSESRSDFSTNNTNIGGDNVSTSKRYVWRKARAIQINNDVVSVRFINSRVEISVSRKVRICIYVYIYLYKYLYIYMYVWINSDIASVRFINSTC